MLEIILTIGLISILISGIFIGAWTDASEQRANFIPRQKIIEISERNLLLSLV